MRKENAKSSDAIDDTESPGEGSFFRRWSLRKRRARSGVIEETADEPQPVEKKVDDVAESTGPERVLTDEDMPPIDSLDEDSDYSGFLSPGVSESLRKLALRKMFLSSKYNVTDGLDDYAEDFTKFAPLGNIITSDMRHQMEMEAERAKQKLEEEARAAMDEARAGEHTEAENASSDSPGEENDGQDTETHASDDSNIGDPGSETSTDKEPRNG